MKTKYNVSKCFSIFLALIMSIGIIARSPLLALAAGDEDVILYVGGVSVTEENAEDILGDGTATYDYDTNILTLKNADITDGSVVEDILVGIYSQNDLNINLIGENNSVTIPDGSINTCGIMVYGNLYVSGGSLNVKCGNITSSVDDVNKIESFGIYTEGKITVSNAVISATAGDIFDVPASVYAESAGALSFGSVEVKDDGHIWGVGGDITGEAEWAASFGIEALGDEGSLIYVAVRDGGLSGTAGDVTTKSISISCGLYILYGDMAAFVNDSFINCEGGKATAESNDGTVTAACSNGAYISGGSFGADGGNINFSAKECTASSIYGDALKVEQKNLGENYFGGYVSINCEEIVLNPYGYGFVGTSVKFKAESGLAMNVGCGVEISDNLVITSPKEGFVDMGDGEYFYLTIMDKDGKEAGEAEIGVLTHKVYINDAERKLSVLVPDGENINDVYCEMMGVDDFSEYLLTEREGFVFEGWYADEEFTKEFDFNDEITSSFTVYGKWTETENIPSEPTDDPSEDVANPGDGGNTTFFILAIVVSSFTIMLAIFKKRT